MAALVLGRAAPASVDELVAFSTVTASPILTGIGEGAARSAKALTIG